MEGFGVVALRALNPNITLVTDESSHGFARMRVHFVNGWALSIIRGHGTYGGDEGLFEAMAIDPAGVMQTEQIFGWMDEAELMKVMDVISSLEPERVAVGA